MKKVKQDNIVWCHINHVTIQKGNVHKTPDDNSWNRSKHCQVSSWGQVLFRNVNNLPAVLPSPAKFPSKFFIRQCMNLAGCKLSMRTAWLVMCNDLGAARARYVPSDKVRYNFTAVRTLLPLFPSSVNRTCLIAHPFAILSHCLICIFCTGLLI